MIRTRRLVIEVGCEFPVQHLPPPPLFRGRLKIL